MKSSKALIIGLGVYIFLSLIGLKTIGQTLVVKGNIFNNGIIATDTTKVVLVDLSTEGNNISFRTNKSFEIQLEDNKNYLLVFQKDNYQAKSIAISTVISNKKKYYHYEFNINLTNIEEIFPDPKFAGGIYYNEKRKTFDYYLANNKQ